MKTAEKQLKKMHRRTLVLLALLVAIAFPAAAHNRTPLVDPSSSTSPAITWNEPLGEIASDELPIIDAATIGAFDEAARIDIGLAAEPLEELDAHLAAIISPAETELLPIVAGGENRCSGFPVSLIGSNLKETGELSLKLHWGHDHVRNRWFDPGTGSWLTPDPLGYQDSSNLYAFCGGDPVNCRDPLGLQARPAPAPRPVPSSWGRPVTRPPAPGEHPGPLATPGAPMYSADMPPESWENFKAAWEAYVAMPYVRGPDILGGKRVDQLTPEEQEKFIAFRNRLRGDPKFESQWDQLRCGGITDLFPERDFDIPLLASAGGGDDGGDESGGWKVGDPTTKLTAKGRFPAWSTQRSRFWKNEAALPSAEATYGSVNVARMKRGLAPQRYNFVKQAMESMELSHEPVPQREGGTAVVPAWPGQHAARDPFRVTGYTKAIVGNE